MALPPLIGIANVQTVEVISHVIQFKPISRMLPNRKKSSKNMLGGGKKSLKVSHAYQLWARYLEGDNISTKIRSGQFEIEIGMAILTF